jgi:hypothetical protein
MVSPWVGLNIFIDPSLKKFAETRPASTNFVLLEVFPLLRPLGALHRQSVRKKTLKFTGLLMIFRCS